MNQLNRTEFHGHPLSFFLVEWTSVICLSGKGVINFTSNLLKVVLYRIWIVLAKYSIDIKPMKIKLEKKHGGSKKNRKQETNRQSPKTMSFGENMKKEAL